MIWKDAFTLSTAFCGWNMFIYRSKTNILVSYHKTSLIMKQKQKAGPRLKHDKWIQNVLDIFFPLKENPPIEELKTSFDSYAPKFTRYFYFWSVARIFVRSVVQTEQKWMSNVSIHDFYNICTLHRHTDRTNTGAFRGVCSAVVCMCMWGRRTTVGAHRDFSAGVWVLSAYIILFDCVTCSFHRIASVKQTLEIVGCASAPALIPMRYEQWKRGTWSTHYERNIFPIINRWQRRRWIVHIAQLTSHSIVERIGIVSNP